MTNPDVVCVSLEPWDDVWRRNQHLAHQLVALDLVRSLTFVTPPERRPKPPFLPESRITVLTPPLSVAPRYGGIWAASLWLRRQLPAYDVLWVNNASLGVRLLGRRAASAVYDVTDDWRSARQGLASRRRLIAAEDQLARCARTIVCSDELHDRWKERYGVDAAVVHNGVDRALMDAAVPLRLQGRPPHLGYVGTLQGERLDLTLVEALAEGGFAGSIHLVGPNHLTPQETQRLARHSNVSLHGPVPADEVPSWLKSMDLLLLPHLVTSFTLSLDAIKAYEYLAARRPVVATPTSGFQHLSARRVAVVGADRFVEAVRAELLSTEPVPHHQVASWEDRAREFASAAWDGDAPTQPPLRPSGDTLS